MESLLIGATGGIVRVFVGFPFDQVKIHLQSHREGTTSITTSVKDIYSKNGMIGFYQGSALSFAFSTFQMSLTFAGKSMTEKHLKDNDLLPQSKFLRTYVSGMVGGTCHALTVAPVDFIRIQQVWLQETTLMGTLRRANLRYLFHGALPTVIRDSVGMGFFFAVYEKMHGELLKRDLDYRTSSLVSGSVAGVTWWGSTYPFDVLKTMMQKNPTRYPRMVSAGTVLYNELGWKGFFRGLSVCLYRAAVVNAAVLCATEVSKPVIYSLNSNRQVL